MNEQRYVISREGRGYIVWDRENQRKASIVILRKAQARAEADARNAQEAR